ncbi:MAG: hypothetical protein U5J99_07995 [Parvularculaceae bacterium]|nr:hypothetical protein [Parvularculaceae bacterium]
MSATSEIIALGFLLSDTKEPRGDIGSRYVMKARFTNVCEADFELRRSCAVAERRYDQAETGDEEPGSREQELSITDRADKTEQLPAPLPTAAVMALLALAGLFFAGDGRRASK